MCTSLMLDINSIDECMHTLTVYHCMIVYDQVPTSLRCTYVTVICMLTISGSELGPGTVSLASPSVRGSRKMPIKVIEKWKEGIEGAESPLNKVRQRIVHFLGALGGQINTSLVESESAAAYAAKAVAWDSKNRLEFALPFQDMKLTLYLGE